MNKEQNLYRNPLAAKGWPGYFFGPALIILCLLLVPPPMSWGQVKISLILQSLPSGTHPSDVFAAGNFNGWQPGSAAHRFDSSGVLVLQLAAGSRVEFKCTLGDWGRVETSAGGSDMPNRRLLATRDTTIHLTVKGWKSNESPKATEHTASANVVVLKQPFRMQKLGRQRTIRLYLPPYYKQDARKYPVLYLMDGQNCFNKATSAYGEWRVDETLDSLWKATGQSVIVVAIDHGGENRISEYSPYDSKRFGNGEGKAFLDFIVRQLKPHIDSNYRTQANRANTWIAGSSMGGVISMYALLAYPNVFGGAGVLSPAFWTNPDIYPEANTLKANLRDARLWMYAGGMEDETMLSNTRKMYREVRHAPLSGLRLWEDMQAGHNEQAWAHWFPCMLKWWLAGE